MKTGLIILLFLHLITSSTPETLFREERFGVEDTNNNTWSLPSEKAKIRHQWEATLPNQNGRFKDDVSSKVRSKGKPPNELHEGFLSTETLSDGTKSSKRVFKNEGALDEKKEIYTIKRRSQGKVKTQLTNKLSEAENSTGNIGRENLKFRIKKRKSYEGNVANITNGIHIQNSKANDENSTKTKVTDIKMNSPFKDFDSNSIFLRKENNKKLEILNLLQEIPSLDFAEPMAVISRPEKSEKCVETVLQGFSVTEDILPEEVLFAKHQAENLSLYLRDSPHGLEGMAAPIMDSMESHPKILMTNVTTMFSTVQQSVIFFRDGTGDGLSMRPQTMDYLKSDLRELPSWTGLFLSCMAKAWVYGYTFDVEDNRGRVETTVYFSADTINITIDQCKSTYREILEGGPKCEGTTTKCEIMPYSGFHLGGYKCVCRDGFYFPDSFSTNGRYFKGYDVEKAKENSSYFKCLPCPESCTNSCDASGICIYQRNNLLKNFILSIQIFCILMTFLLIVLIFKHRKCKTIAIGMWTIMEMILLGSIILYSTVVIRAFDATAISCLIEPWFREIGFVLCYGAIILKLYRILIEFRTRKAHRWVIRDKDLLKYLLGMVIVVFGYMSAWTASNLYLIRKENYSMLTTGETLAGNPFKACKPVWWDYVTQTGKFIAGMKPGINFAFDRLRLSKSVVKGEILILLFGIHLSYASRNATTQFRERCFLCISISVEAFFSGIYYLLRYFSWQSSIHPDISYVANFIRCQLTTTVVLILLFAPKWWYQKKHNNKSKVSRNYLSQESSRVPLEAFKPQDGVSTPNNDIESEVSLADMTPEEIRSELKRLYTQLELLKNKTIRMDNPHISKRRGGRKIAHRRFSLQKKGSKEKALRQQPQRLSAKQSEAEVTEVGQSGTPEDSICSNEGPSIIINDGPSDIIQMTPKKGQK